MADTDNDGDGVPNCIDPCPDDPNKTEPGICGCGVADTDRDGDGTPDCNDLCPDDPNKTEPGICGCGVADTDRDGDGAPDCNDLCPDDPNKTKPGMCGCGVPEGCPLPLASWGLAYAPFRQHESPEGLQPASEEIQEDLSIMKAILVPPRRLRVYSATGASRMAATMAIEQGFDVVVGAWIGPDPAVNEEEIASLIQLANAYPVRAALVGNEAILRGDVSVDGLADMIRRVRAQVPAQIPVGTAEPWSTWTLRSDASVLAEPSDILVVHVHPFWEGKAVEDAVSSVFQRYDEVANSIGRGKLVVLGETGWPSDGVRQGDAVPSPENQARFVQGFLSERESRGVDAFFFSAFDEPWKGIAKRESTVGDFQNEGETGAHWGLFAWNRRIKSELASLFPKPPAPLSPTLEYRVFTRGLLSPGHDMGVNTSAGRFDWVLASQETLRLSYPEGGCWGSVFITVGTPTAEIPRPSYKDFSDFKWLAFGIRGESGGEAVEVALKDNQAPDDGSEPKVRISNLGTEWQDAVIPLDDFAPMNLSRLYVTPSFNFVGTSPATVFVKDVRYIPADGAPPQLTAQADRVVLPNTGEGDVYVNGCLSRWYSIGLDTSSGTRDWLEEMDGGWRLSYPAGQAWGAVFLAVGELAAELPRPFFQDFSSFSVLSFEARGERGGEVFDVGTKDRYAADTGRETKVPVGPLSSTWTRFEIPLSRFTGTNMAELYIPFEAVFGGGSASTVFIRDVRYAR